MRHHAPSRACGRNVPANMADATTSYASVEAFYTGDEQRRTSPELDFGVWWRHAGVVYRLTWVEATGELVAVQLSPPVAVRLAAPARELLAPDDGFVVGIFGIGVIGG